MIVEKLYTCPMKEHYAIFTDCIAKCPQCGMALVEIGTDTGETESDHADLACNQDQEDGRRLE